MIFVGWGVLLLILAAIAWWFAFGVAGTRTPYAYKVAFYTFLILFLVTLALGLFQQPKGGYDPVPDHPRGDRGE